MEPDSKHTFCGFGDFDGRVVCADGGTCKSVYLDVACGLTQLCVLFAGCACGGSLSQIRHVDAAENRYVYLDTCNGVCVTLNTEIKKRKTKQHSIILSVVRGMDHPTADEVYARLRQSAPFIGRATVYRNLSRMTQEGLLKRVDLPDSATRYDCTVKPHSHFVCRNCGAIIDLDVLPEWHKVQVENMKIETCAYVFSGLCEMCGGREDGTNAPQ